MSDIKKAEIFDDYDFSDGVRGRFYKPKKVPYQSLINALLRKELEAI